MSIKNLGGNISLGFSDHPPYFHNKGYMGRIWVELNYGFGYPAATARFCFCFSRCCLFSFFSHRQPLPSSVLLPSPTTFNAAIASSAISLCRTRQGKARVRVLPLASVATIMSPATSYRRRHRHRRRCLLSLSRTTQAGTRLGFHGLGFLGRRSRDKGNEQKQRSGFLGEIELRMSLPNFCFINFPFSLFY